MEGAIMLRFSFAAVIVVLLLSFSAEAAVQPGFGKGFGIPGLSASVSGWNGEDGTSNASAYIHSDQKVTRTSSEFYTEWQDPTRFNWSVNVSGLVGGDNFGVQGTNSSMSVYRRGFYLNENLNTYPGMKWDEKGEEKSYPDGSLNISGSLNMGRQAKGDTVELADFTNEFDHTLDLRAIMESGNIYYSEWYDDYRSEWNWNLSTSVRGHFEGEYALEYGLAFVNAPEPSALAMLPFAGALLLKRRRKVLS
ncbi:MAG: PEP-CTERM sorting domain-containing protein [bacterium]|nr:PEP-CTERM sorting domain-containing protein [bacterium]